MTSSALNLQTTKVRVTLTITQGPDQGKSFQIIPPKITIGRDPSSHIILQDSKCSRNQAVIQVLHDRILLEDLSSKKTSLVNGVQSDSVNLKHGDSIEFVQPTSQPLQAIRPPHQAASMQRPRAQVSKKSNGRLRFYIIVIALFGLGWYFLNSPTPAKVVEQSVRNQDKTDAETKRAEAQYAQDSASRKLNSAEAKARFDQAKKKLMSGNEAFELGKFQDAIKSYEDSIGLFTDYFGTKRYSSPEEKQKYQEANRHYLEGFRDYNNGQYSRAVRSFETSLAIDPTHKLAGRYREYAMRSREEYISGQLEMGKQYHEKQMYGRCAASLEKVLVEIRDESDLRYKEAVALKRVCDSYVRKGD
jgi:tetratricopeptide (TPR) repeat protein